MGGTNTQSAYYLNRGLMLPRSLLVDIGLLQSAQSCIAISAPMCEV